MHRSGVSFRPTASSQPLNGIRPGETTKISDNDYESISISYKLNQSQLLSGKDSNRSQPKSGNDTGHRAVLVLGHFSGWRGVYERSVLILGRFSGWGATTVYPPKVKPQFGLCEGDFAVYPASRNGGKRHHPASEVVLGGGGAV